MALFLGFSIVGHVVPQRADYFHLQLFHLLWISEAMAFCKIRSLIIVLAGGLVHSDDFIEGLII